MSCSGPPTYGAIVVPCGGRRLPRGPILDEWWDFTTWGVRYDGWVESGAGGSTTTVGGAATQDPNHPGIIDCVLADTAGANVNYRRSITCLSFGAGYASYEQVLKINNLPTAVDDYRLQLGFTDTAGGVAPTDAVMAKVQGTLNAGLTWHIETAEAGVRNTYDTGLSAVAGWQYIKIEINADATEWRFWVTDLSGAAPVTTVTDWTASPTIPTGTNTTGIASCSALYIAGAPGAIFSTDYVRTVYEVTR